MTDTIEVKVGSERYIAKTHPDSMGYYSCILMDDTKNHNNIYICEEIGRYPKGKLNAINTILRYAGTYTYQTWAKKAQASA